MADSISSNTTLDIDFAFVDGDTRLNKFKNPKANITRADIENLNTLIRSGNMIIGDREGATFAQIKSAKRVTKTTATYDLDQY